MNGGQPRLTEPQPDGHVGGPADAVLPAPPEGQPSWPGAWSMCVRAALHSPSLSMLTNRAEAG